LSASAAGASSNYHGYSGDVDAVGDLILQSSLWLELPFGDYGHLKASVTMREAGACDLHSWHRAADNGFF